MADIPQPAPVNPENEPAPVNPENEPAPVNPPIQRPPEILTHGRDTFRLVYPLPTNDGIYLYRATLIRTGYAARISFQAVCIKFVKMAEHPVGFNNLRNQVELSNSVGDHDKILTIEPPFISGEGYYCVWFRYMDEGSVRYLMSTHMPNGIPENNIAIVLRDTLQGLAAIHAVNQFHKEINADHVFFETKPGSEFEFKLGFGASVHHFFTADPTLFLPLNAVAPPEVVNPDHQDYTAKADIWLVGIMALELAYGVGYVSSRDELLAIVEKINRTKKLPKNLKKQGPDFEMQETHGTDLKQKQKIVDFVDFVRIENPFSKKIQNFVVKCLDLDPAIRPTAENLLNHEFMMIM